MRVRSAICLLGSMEVGHSQRSGDEKGRGIGWVCLERRAEGILPILCLIDWQRRRASAKFASPDETPLQLLSLTKWRLQEKRQDFLGVLH